MHTELNRAGGKPAKWYFNLTTQVLVAMFLGALAGWMFPQIGAALKPFAELFIKMVKMVIGPLVFLMVVAGISGMGDLKKVGRVGVKAVVYFEVVTTVALVVGLWPAIFSILAHTCRRRRPPRTRMAAARITIKTRIMLMMVSLFGTRGSPPPYSLCLPSHDRMERL